MAIYNEILAPRFARGIQKLFSMKGSVPTRQLSGEIMPVLPLFYGAENRYLEGWGRFAAELAIGAVAAQNDATQIRNPLGSNLVTVLESIAIEVDVADFVVVSMAQNNIDLTNPVQGFRLDPRGPANSFAVLSAGNNFASLANIIRTVGVAASIDSQLIQTELQEFTLFPGDSIRFKTTAVNTNHRCSITWRERPLEESERA